MTTYKIEGIENIDYVSKKTNERVIGVKLYISFPINEKRGKGRKTDSVYLSKRTVENLSYFPDVDDEVDFVYNRFGGISDVVKI